VRRCPAIESSKYLCGRAAEYEVRGSVYCATHARRLVDKHAKIEAVLDVLTEAAIDAHALPADLWRAIRLKNQAERNGDH
jgi:hypothetical protein